MTDAERRLWSKLRAHRFQGASFRRQTPIGPYIVDFFCPAARLIIELDGGQHGSTELVRDKVRDAWLQAEGYRVLRFWNNDALRNTNGVLEAIAEALAVLATPLPNPPPQGGRGPAESVERTT